MQPLYEPSARPSHPPDCTKRRMHLFFTRIGCLCRHVYTCSPFQTPAAASCFPSSSSGHANWQHVLCRPDRHCYPLGYEIVIYILSGRACAPVYHRVLKMGAPIDEQIAGKSRIRRRKGNQQVSNKSSLSHQAGAGWASRPKDKPH
jgi:hypothetical protein